MNWAAVKRFDALCWCVQAVVALPLIVLPWASFAPAADNPLPGQIVIDPDHPQWLKRHGGGHLFICGPGDPEDFLYRGRRLSSGTRDGDQKQLIRKLIEHGGNCIYMQAVRSHGGDGRADHNPFVDSDPAKGLDDDILAQWEEWFTLMDEHDIVIYFFLFDDGANPWRAKRKGDEIPAAMEQFVKTIVRRFKHHRNLIWIVAEESEEAFSHTQARRIAAAIAEADDHGHLIGNHHHSGPHFKSFQPGGPLNHYSMQYTRAGDAAHAGAIEALKIADGRYQVIYSESTAADPTIEHAWACAMGGLMPMMLDMDIASTPAATLRQCRWLQTFFERTDFCQMQPHDELAHAGTRWVLAHEKESLILYARKASGGLGVKDLPAGEYALHWLDCDNGKMHTAEESLRAAGRAVFDRPPQIGPHCALWVKRKGDRSGASKKSDNSNARAKTRTATPADSRAATVFPGRSWQTRRPQEVGLDEDKLAAFARAVGGDGVVVQRGYLVKTWGRPERRGDWASAAKPVISTLLLFAVHEGRLQSVNEPIRPFVRRLGKDLAEKDRSMTFRHLANMTSGYARAERPGTHWAYNDYGIRLYHLVMEQMLESSLNEAARERLATLQLEDGDIFGSRGGGGVSTSPRDFARIGWFWLHHGRWRDRQLLPSELLTQSMKADVPADLPRTKEPGSDYLKIGTHGGGSDQSADGPGVYGFNWWFNTPSGGGDLFMPHLPPDAFQANGHWGREVMLIVPSWQLVAAARGDWGGLQLAKARLLVEAIVEE